MCGLFEANALGNRRKPIDAQLGHRFAREGLYLQPDLEFALLRPKLAHPRPGITIDHPAKIKAQAKTESVLYAKKRRFNGSPAKRRFSESFLAGRD